MKIENKTSTRARSDACAWLNLPCYDLTLIIEGLGVSCGLSGHFTNLSDGPSESLGMVSISPERHSSDQCYEKSR